MPLRLTTALPAALVVLAAAIPVSRLPILAALALGLVVGRGDPPRRWAWAAPIPVAVTLAWGLLPESPAAPDGSQCAMLLSPPAAWRFGEAAFAFATVAALASWLPSPPSDLGLKRPSRGVLAVSVAGFVLVGPLAISLGPALSEPFFGPIDLNVGQLGAILPALLFAISNGTLEELVYRGALQSWLGRVARPWLAIATQAIAFGLAHGAGTGLVGSPVPVIAAMILGGTIAGVIVRRTGTLTLPIALHVAFDIPLYYYWACSGT
jgi:membrane protease YdiL (CAAX protease family)